jgi:hypothetical protein
LSFFDEKQHTPWGKQSVATVAPVTAQPCKQSSVFVENSDTMTKEVFSGHRDIIAQEVVYEQQIAPCISISSTTDNTFLVDEFNVEKSQGKLSSSNEPEISSDFQMDQLQKDIVSSSPEFQAQAEIFLIDPETVGRAPHKEEAVNQKAFPNDTLATSFSHDDCLNGKLNDLDACTKHQNERFISDPLNLPLEEACDEVSLQTLEPVVAFPDPCDAAKEEDKSVLGSKVEMLSGFVTKVKSFSGCLIEPPKTFSGLFSSPKSPKKNSIFSLSSNASSQPLKSELFGIFRSTKPETSKQESSVATSWLQNGCSRDAIASVPPGSLHREVVSAGLNSDSILSDHRMTVFSAKSESDDPVTDDPKLTTEMEKNTILGIIPEPPGFETVATSSVSDDDMGQGILSLSDEGDMGILQGTDTEASLEAEHDLSTQVHPDPALIAEELPPPSQAPFFEPEPDIQTALTNQDFLELHASNSLETSSVLFEEVSVSEGTTLGTPGYLSHPLQEEPVLCAKESDGILHAQKYPPAVPQETEQSRPRFEIPTMTSWPKPHFPSSTTDQGKTLSSFFFPPSPSGSRAAETGLICSFKKLSTLFEGSSEGKGSMLASDPKLGFGRKLDLSFPWPKENKGVPEQMPAESSPPVLVISSDQDVNLSEAYKALDSSQVDGASAESAEAYTQPSGTTEQLKAKPSVRGHGLSGNQPEIPASREHWGTNDNLFGSACPSGKLEEEHCTVSELLHQQEKQEEEVVSASTDSVSNVQQLLTLNDAKQPMTNKRPVFNSCIINDFKELTIYDANDFLVDYDSLLFILPVSFLAPKLHVN